MDDVSLEVEEGEIFGLLGPNGAGKSTLVRLLCTLILPTSGRAWICGHDLGEEEAVKAHVGLACGEERSFYWRLSGRENLRFFGALQGLARSYVDARLAELEETLELGPALEERFDRLSTGMRRRLDLARALLHAPPVLFLDEPTRSLDPEATARLHELIRRIARSGCTVFLVTHHLDEAEALCDRVAVMHRGRLRAVAPVAGLRSAVGFRRRYLLTLILPPHLSSPPWTGWPWPVEERPDAPPGCRRLAVELPDTVPIEALLRPLLESGIEVVDAGLEPAPLEEVFQRLTMEDNTTAPLLVEGPRPAESRPRAPTPPRLPPLQAAAGRVLAFLRRDLLTQVTYRLATLLQLLGMLLSVAAFYFMARLLGPAASPYLSEYGGNYFAFVLIGIAFGGYQAVGLYAFSGAIRSGQMQGTLEAILVTPTRLETFLGTSALWSFLLASGQVVLYLGMGVALFGAPLGPANVGTALLVLLLSLLAFSGLGILSAAFILVTKRGDPVQFVLSGLSSLLSGIYYPVGVLPTWLQPLSYLFPMTYTLRAIRLALLQGAGSLQVGTELALLGLFAALTLPAGVLAFRLALRQARAEGSLTQF
ncbi:MAG: ABC transporter ATP-binding protein/permease [Chloroflexia bacterium]